MTLTANFLRKIGYSASEASTIMHKLFLLNVERKTVTNREPRGDGIVYGNPVSTFDLQEAIDALKKHVEEDDKKVNRWNPVIYRLEQQCAPE